MTNFFKRPPSISTSANQNSNKHNLDTTDKINELSLKMVKILKYNDIEYGFTYLNENGIDVPQCVTYICKCITETNQVHLVHVIFCSF
jgi:hypothetical protein